MRTLNFLDYAIIFGFTALSIGVGLLFTRKANKSTSHYFLAARNAPWWLLGTSMAASNFSTDTPLAITKAVYQEGIAGVWLFWNGAIQICLATFLFSQLWRRAEVMTDIEIVEQRYGGEPARILRLFKGLYLGLIMNALVMGWIYKGLIKMITVITNMNSTQVLVIATATVGVYTLAAGFYGVIWTEFLQYFVELAACMVLAYYAVHAAGGMEPMLGKLRELYGEGSGLTNFYPHWPQADQWMPLSVFLTYVCIQWWAHKYSDGGGKHIQRMSSARTEKDAILGTFFFSFMNFIVRIWPWILTALAGLVVLGRDVKDAELVYPMMIAKVLPNGWLGLLVVMAISAFMSTISTHTNLGSSYMVNDIYRRFIKKDASDRHYLIASKIATVLTLGLSIAVALNMESINAAWKLMMELVSGAGAVFVLRWFWWRVNAWSELSAMIASCAITLFVELTQPKMIYSHKIWIILGTSTLVWLTTTFLTKPVDDETLRGFVAKVGPAKFGWRRIYTKYGLTTTFTLRQNFANFALGLIFLFCFNFGIGNVLLANHTTGLMQLGIAVVVFVWILKRINRQSDDRLRIDAQKQAASTVASGSRPVINQ